MGSNFDSTAVNISRDIKELRLNFDEYINLKEVSKNLIISPPLQKITKIIPSNLANKYILIQWEDTLQANTTYSFNFGNAIADNNEGNVLPYFTYAFSTGDKIDNLYISGEVKDGLKPTKSDIRSKETNVVVGLYKAVDSVNFHQKPYYISKVDPDGYFEINYLSPGSYHIIAFDDSNQNSIFDQGKENVGFQKDIIQLNQSVTGLNLKLYPSKQSIKFIESKPRPGGLLLTFEGHPKKVSVMGISPNLTDYKFTHKADSDSVQVWFDTTKFNSVGNQSEKIELSYNADNIKTDTLSLFYRKLEDDVMTIENSSSNVLPPNSDFVITSNFVVNHIMPEKWTLESDSIRVPFTAKISESNPFEIKVSSNFKEGKQYQFTVPKETISSYYQSNGVSKRFDFEIDKLQNYGQLTMKFTNRPTQKFWIQLLDDSGEIAYSKFIDSDTVSFSEIKPSNYTVRILVDNNGNGVWDVADFYNGIQPEEVYLYPKELAIRPMWENTEVWDIKSNSAVPPVFQNKE